MEWTRTLTLLYLLTFKVLVSGKLTYTYFSKERAVLFEEGKLQFNSLQERTNTPRYGLCWKQAVVHLEANCKHLDEHVQSIMALKFMDCFLKMSGYEPYECDKAFEKDVCMKGMSDRAFNVYTEFYTHTQAICFFLQSQIWHEETETTIDRLSSSSAHVAEQLEQAEELQTALLEQQKESMSVQLELLNNGLTLNEVLQNSQNSLHVLMQEFHSSALEQKKMLFEVFERLSSIQSWVLGEVSWLDTVVFYIASIIISYIVTSTHRTRDARLWIFILLSVNALLERVIVSLLLQDNTKEFEALDRNIDSWIWLCRKFTISCCALAIGVAVYLYCDYNIVNHELLLQIRKQNSELLSSLQKLNLSQNCFHGTDTITMEAENDSTPVGSKINQLPASFLSGMKLYMDKSHANSLSPVPPIYAQSSEKSILDVQSNEKRRHANSPSPVPSISTESSEEIVLDVRSTEKRRRPKRILELQASPHQYNLRRSSTPSIPHQYT